MYNDVWDIRRSVLKRWGRSKKTLMDVYRSEDGDGEGLKVRGKDNMKDE